MSRFNVRNLTLENSKEAQAALTRYVGSSDYGKDHMSHKSRIFCLLVENVRTPAAHIIKESALACGGEAAVHHDVVIGGADLANVLLMATREQYRQLSKRLRKQQFGMKTLAAEIDEVLAAVDGRKRWVLSYHGGELVFGERTLVMGILNVTPDSFSDGGRWRDKEVAVEHALAMAEAGADVIDIGGESTVPGKPATEADEEMARVLPVIEALAPRLKVPISIDTYKAVTAEAALQAGAAMINDVWGFQRDQAMAAVAARYDCPVILMHNKAEIAYDNYFGEVLAFLRESIELAVAAGCRREQLIVDPGFGFGKDVVHNLAITHKLSELAVLGCPILMAASRKRTIGAVLGGVPTDERLVGDLALASLSVAYGAHMVRVHDVEPVVKALKVADAIVGQGYF